MNPDTHDYIISGGQEGKNRLNILAEVLQNHTMSLLKKQGVATGMSFLDVGCGGGNVALMVAKMVGHNGKVAGIDFDEEIISLARTDAASCDTRNVSFQAISADSMAYKNKFDIAYSRFLLSHVKDPFEVLRKMKQSVKPGGKIIVEDVEFRGHFCYPACPAFDKYVECYTLAARQNGADANIGPSLFSMFNKAGIQDVRFDVIQPSFNAGDGKWMAYITLDKIKATLVEHGIASQEAIAHLLLELEAFTKDAGTIISLPRIFRVWGTKK